MNMRTLKPTEIDVRVGSINEKGATLLLYKDARVDMNILDESGEVWKRQHDTLNGKLFCTVSIWNDSIKEWVSRQDVGVESQSEKTKGEASDSFKRACFNWGIGRELYTAPFIWISSDGYSSYTNMKTKKLATYDKFTVDSIDYNDHKEIVSLVIKNDKTKRVVFTLGQQSIQPTVVRDRVVEASSGSEPMGESLEETLTRRKGLINERLIQQNYLTVDAKRAFITGVLQHATIDNLNEADSVMDALENEL